MNLLRITNGFDKLSDNDLEVRANNIIASMTGNADFPTPTPTLAAMQAAADAYTNALAKAKTGSLYEKAFKNQKKAELTDLLHSLGNYVLFTANGDALKARSSGFNIAKGPSPSPQVTPAANQQLEDGPNTGELAYSFGRVAGAKSYIYQYTTDPLTESSAWKSEVGTVRRIVFTGLESGKKYWCRVMAIGINGQGVYSEPVSRIVQ
jgi:hypothetical protein